MAKGKDGGMMKKILLAVLLLVLPNALFADAGGAVKRYPPYPDVWGYELPWPSADDPGTLPKFYKMPDGEVTVTYLAELKKVVQPDGTCCNLDLKSAALSFFTGKTWKLTDDEMNAFGRQEKGKYVPHTKSILLPDGTQIVLKNEGHPKCYIPVPGSLAKINPAGRVELRKTVVYLPERPYVRPINPFCEGANGADSVIEKVEAFYSSLVPLDEGSFLLYDLDGHYILRLDKDLTIRYKPNERFFLVDRSAIDTLVYGKDDAAAIEAVFKYVLGLKERSKQ